LISASASTEIERPVSEVFRFATDPTNDPVWHTDMVRGLLEPPGPPAKGQVLYATYHAFGRTADAVADVTVFEPDRRVVYTYRTPTFGLKPTITYLFEPLGDRTRFTRGVNAEPSGLVRLLAPLMAGQIAKRNARFVQNLKRTLESAP
jgi:uncharacterized protein YndB with AHSA1/START domain